MKDQNQEKQMGGGGGEGDESGGTKDVKENRKELFTKQQLVTWDKSEKMFYPYNSNDNNG